MTWLAIFSLQSEFHHPSFSLNCFFLLPSMYSITPKQVDVLVVGAGLSGLRAALMVQAAGYSCAVVEAIDRVGGKTLSVPSNPGSSGVNDIGAAWINDTTQKEMYQLLKKYGLHGEVQFAEGMSVMQLPNTSILHPHGELPVISSSNTRFIL